MGLAIFCGMFFTFNLNSGILHMILSVPLVMDLNNVINLIQNKSNYTSFYFSLKWIYLCHVLLFWEEVNQRELCGRRRERGEWEKGRLEDKPLMKWPIRSVDFAKEKYSSQPRPKAKHRMSSVVLGYTPIR